MDKDCSKGTGPSKQNVEHLSNQTAAFCPAVDIISDCSENNAAGFQHTEVIESGGFARALFLPGDRNLSLMGKNTKCLISIVFLAWTRDWLIKRCFECKERIDEKATKLSLIL